MNRRRKHNHAARKAEKRRKDRKPSPDPQDLRAAEFLRFLMAGAPNEPCLLCGGKSDMLGLFVPSSPLAVRVFDVPANKVRTIPYTLCLPCRRSPDCANRAEKRLMEIALLRHDETYVVDLGDAKPIPRQYDDAPKQP